MTDSKKTTQMEMEELFDVNEAKPMNIVLDKGHKCISLSQTLEDLKEKQDYIFPSHYKLSSGLEVKDIMKDVMGAENVKQFYKGNIIKYILRADKKNGLEDYKKAKRYIEMLEELENE